MSETRVNEVLRVLDPAPGFRPWHGGASKSRITDVEVLGKSDQKAAAKKHDVAIYIDNGDAPGYNCVTKGELVVQAESDGGYWANAQIKPLVLFPKHKYWLVFEDESITLQLARGKKGGGAAVSYTSGKPGQWAATMQGTLFLKFHGRVMPVVT